MSPACGLGVLEKASGGKVCHLESWLRMRFNPRSSGQITSAFDSGAFKDPSQDLVLSKPLF